jgi:hypothetical protein
MRKSRFSEEQMVAFLREADRSTVAEPSSVHEVAARVFAAGEYIAAVTSTWRGAGLASRVASVLHKSESRGDDVALELSR